MLGTAGLSDTCLLALGDTKAHVHDQHLRCSTTPNQTCVHHASLEQLSDTVEGQRIAAILAQFTTPSSVLHANNIRLEEPKQNK